MTLPLWAWLWVAAGGVVYLGCIQGILRTRFFEGFAMLGMATAGIWLPSLSMALTVWGDDPMAGWGWVTVVVATLGLATLFILPLILHGIRLREKIAAEALKLKLQVEAAARARQDESEEWLRRFGV